MNIFGPNTLMLFLSFSKGFLQGMDLRVVISLVVVEGRACEL